MISITRSVVRHARTTFRKVTDAEFREKPTSVVILADASGLRLQTRAGGVGAEYHIPGSFPSASILVPIAALLDFEGADESLVRLSEDPSGGIRAEWTNSGVPQWRVYEPVKSPRPALELPKDFETVDASCVLGAIQEAMSAAADGSTKFTLTHILLRGSRQEAVGSDGRQLLIRRGVPWPWSEDVLVPRTPLLTAKAFQSDSKVAIGRTDEHVVICVGSWTAWLAINTKGRFPPFESIIPRDAGNGTRMILSADDAAFLAKSLPRLPGQDEFDSPITVHLNGAVVVRAKGDLGPMTEVRLCGSRVDGKEVKMRTNRSYLLRAVQLGLHDFRYTNDSTPVVAESKRHLYVWMPLPAKGALGASSDCLRIDSSARSPATTDEISPTSSRTIMKPDTSTSRDDHDVETTEEAALDPLQEAEAIRTQFREILSRVNRLVHAIKRQRKQAQLVRATLASLKQLQNVA